MVNRNVIPEEAGLSKEEVEKKYREAHIDKCIEEVQTMRQARRPTLILCETIDRCKNFSEALTRCGIVHRLLTDVQSEDESFIIIKAGEAQSVTVATHAAGRGTDIKLTRESLDAGGLHVIISCFPKNGRVEDQAIGRAGRQGQPGSARLIIDDISVEDVLNNPLAVQLSQLLSHEQNPMSALLLQRDAIVAATSSQRKEQAWKEVSRHAIQKNFFDLISFISSWMSKHENIAILAKSFEHRSQPSLAKNRTGLIAALTARWSQERQQDSEVLARRFCGTLKNVLKDHWAIFFDETDNIEEVDIAVSYHGFLKEQFHDCDPAELQRSFRGVVHSLLKNVLWHQQSS